MAEKHPFNVISICCCSLELLNEKQVKFGAASGFLWRHENRIFLITNWHVVTGLHAFTRQHLDNGRCPAALRVHYTVELPFRKFASAHIDAPLYKDFHAPYWIEHSTRTSRSIDVIALPLDIVISPFETIHCINDHSSDDLVEMVGVDVFPVGFPLGVPSGPKFPIWKRGSIATEPGVNWEGRPAFLIDCRTSSGMSGSPVIRQVFGPAPMADGEIKVDRIRSFEFLGVYSGRLSDDDNVASIGIVWRKTVISEMLLNQTRGTRS